MLLTALQDLGALRTKCSTSVVLDYFPSCPNAKEGKEFSYARLVYSNVHVHVQRNPKMASGGKEQAA